MSAPLNHAPAVRVGGLHRVFFHPRVALVALVALALSFALPEGGLGVDLCWFNSLTGLPCPGCGLTRSAVAIGGQSWSLAWGYNPFGFVAYGLSLLCAPWILVPIAPREAIMARLDPYRRAIHWGAIGLTLGLLSHGAARLIYCALTGATLPL